MYRWSIIGQGEIITRCVNAQLWICSLTTPPNFEHAISSERGALLEHITPTDRPSQTVSFST